MAPPARGGLSDVLSKATWPGGSGDVGLHPPSGQMCPVSVTKPLVVINLEEVHMSPTTLLGAR